MTESPVTSLFRCQQNRLLGLWSTCQPFPLFRHFVVEVQPWRWVYISLPHAETSAPPPKCEIHNTHMGWSRYKLGTPARTNDWTRSDLFVTMRKILKNTTFQILEMGVWVDSKDSLTADLVGIKIRPACTMSDVELQIPVLRSSPCQATLRLRNFKSTLSGFPMSGKLFDMSGISVPFCSCYSAQTFECR